MAMKNPDLIGRDAAIKLIPFNTEMVLATLEGRKTQTRGIVKGIDGLNVYHAEPSEDSYESCSEWDFFYGGCLPDGALYDAIQSVKAPCSIGDILLVKEPWCKNKNPQSQNFGGYEYRADYNGAMCQNLISWHSPTYMPREAARIFLRVKDVRVERLNDMSEEDAIAEGFADSPAGTDSPLERFSASWDKTIKREDLREYGIHANPWVWVIEFERCEKPEGWCR